MKDQCKWWLSVLFFLLSIKPSTGQVIHSPDGKLILEFQLKNRSAFYSVRYNGDQVLNESRLGLVFSGNDSLSEFKLTGADTSSVNENWNPVWGVYKRISNHYNQLIVHLSSHSNTRLSIVFRVFNDGCAFRYIVQGDSMQRQISAELTTFSLSENDSCWWYWADYNTLEKLYYHTPVMDAPHVATPFTIQKKNGTCITIAEASITDYTTMTLLQDSTDKLCYHVNLVPWADGVAVKTSIPFQTPWRTILVTDDPKGLLSSSLISNLNEPSKSKDISWIRPMKYIGIWWEMHLGLSTWKMEGGRHGATTQNAKHYIDFAAAHHIDGVLIEGWNTGWEHWGEKDAFDFTSSYADYNLPEIVHYAQSKGVEIIMHNETGGDILSYEKNMERAFAYYHRLGIHYLKTGYAGPVNPPTEHHHGQYMVEHFNKVMEMAAKYELNLDVHEPVIPSGLGRTWPNLMTFEGVRGMEWNAWSEGNPPSHTCTLPFTRGLAGPIDYDAGIFDIQELYQQEKHVKWNGNDKGKNAVHATLSNQIALMVVLYSPLQMAADLPENYEGNPAFQLIEQIPATWDTSIVLEAVIGECVVVARKSGNKWFIAGITNEQQRTFKLPLSFLDDRTAYQLTECIDGEKAHFENNPTSYQILSSKIKKSDFLNVTMQPGGGFLVICKPSAD